MTELTPAEVLSLPMQPNDADAGTVRDYLVSLVAEVWQNGEGFSGKRPFGNSGWALDLMYPLAKVGVITGEFDDDGYLEDCDRSAGYDIITAAIEELRRVGPATA